MIDAIVSVVFFLVLIWLSFCAFFDVKKNACRDSMLQINRSVDELEKIFNERD